MGALYELSLSHTLKVFRLEVILMNGLREMGQHVLEVVVGQVLRHASTVSGFEHHLGLKSGRRCEGALAVILPLLPQIS